MYSIAVTQSEERSFLSFEVKSAKVPNLCHIRNMKLQSSVNFRLRLNLRLLDLRLVQRHRAVTNPVMATKKLVTSDACRGLDAPVTAAGPGAGAEDGASIAVATPRLEMTTAAIITLAAADFMVDAVLRKPGCT
ncbi:hypothetical protein R1sor_022745 [Riccia sorocarpa]|uniref:Uncharacterized protein n=1 Tax=Riccia sorocarpa TaxID=122646 RepID=A0ABD3GRN3_9MARC